MRIGRFGVLEQAIVLAEGVLGRVVTMKLVSLTRRAGGTTES